MGIVICELGFDKPDPRNPTYSLREVDFYAWIPFVAQIKYGIRNHRLSLRKNLVTGKFEVYRYYLYERREEVVFTGDFQEALEFANCEWDKYFSEIEWSREPDEPCQHKWPKIDTFFCPACRRVREVRP